MRRIVSSCQAAPGKGGKTFIGQLAATAAAGVAPGACREPLPDNPRYAAGKLSSTASILLNHIKYVHPPLNAERNSSSHGESKRVQRSIALSSSAVRPQGLMNEPIDLPFQDYTPKVAVGLYVQIQGFCMTLNPLLQMLDLRMPLDQTGCVNGAIVFRSRTSWGTRMQDVWMLSF